MTRAKRRDRIMTEDEINAFLSRGRMPTQGDHSFLLFVVVVILLVGTLILVPIIWPPEPTCEAGPMETHQPACDRWESAPWRGR